MKHLNIETNPLLDKLPSHLTQYIKPQTYEDYTPINQAVWRYVMRRNVPYLSKVAHDSYLKGLEKTGISIDSIPSMYGMNRILREIGWAAVAVDGFIPPNAFMEFQAYNILVIASDIRQLENIEYTPAPDIIHEAAGHAPIIASPDYAEYLRRFGEIGSKAISSAKDYEMYEAVRLLSILKEAPGTPQLKIQEAQNKVEELQNSFSEPSEMSMIRNLHWWTVEYGLVGEISDPKIYGAGLLSSIGESVSCLKEDVKKIPYSIEAAYQDFDITKPQPQLYVTPDFAYLCQVLEEFANTMALRTGGFRGVDKLIESKSLGTIELNTGIQISGVFSNLITDDDNKVVYFKTSGPTALAYRDKELVNNGTAHHIDGFGSPMGKLKGINLSIEDMGPLDLKAYKIYEGERISLEYESGIIVEGLVITGKRNLQGKLFLIQLEDCTVTYGDTLLFEPSWGVFDMVVGTEVVSAYSGPADFTSFDLLSHVSNTETIHHSSDAHTIALEGLYQNLRDLRKSKKHNIETVKNIFYRLKNEFPNDWLLSLEIYELIYHSSDKEFKNLVYENLISVINMRPQVSHLIKEGLKLIESIDEIEIN